MSRDYHVSKLPLHRNLFGDSERVFEIVCKSQDLNDLKLALRGVISHGNREPITMFEQDVLCDLYNSISLISLK